MITTLLTEIRYGIHLAMEFYQKLKFPGKTPYFDITIKSGHKFQCKIVEKGSDSDKLVTK